MSRDMRILKNHIGAFLEQLINNLCDRLLIARNRIGRKDHGVALSNRNLLVHPARHPAECRHALPLTSRRDNDGLVLWIIFEPLNIYHSVLGNADTV